MKHVDVEKLVAEAVPLAPSLNTRKEKLSYLARLLQKNELPFVALYHNVEYWPNSKLKTAKVDPEDGTVFGIALSDPHLKAAGVGDTIHKQMEYFDVSQYELHMFSCDCGGAIRTDTAASRVEKLANSRRLEKEPSGLDKFRSYFRWNDTSKYQV